MLDWIAQLLLIPGDAIRQFILAVPLSGAKAVFIAYPVILIFWLMMFRKDEVQGKLDLWGDRTIDIRPFAVIALLGQVLIYAWF